MMPGFVQQRQNKSVGFKFWMKRQTAVETNQSNPAVADTPLQEGNVFVVKPSITYNGQSDVGHVGDTVVVTKNGAERLGTRPIEHYYHVD